MFNGNLWPHLTRGTMLLIMSLFGLVLELIYYSCFVFSDFIIFFAILVVVVFPTLYAILFLPEQKYLNLFLILVDSLFFNSMYLFYSLSLPYVPPQDAVYHFQITDAIVKTHHIPIISSVRDPYSAYALGPYSQYPAYHLLSAVLSMTTGLNPALIIKLSPLIALVGPFIIFSLSKYVFKSDQISFLAAFLWVFVPFSYPVPSYTLLAYIFLPIFLLLFMKLKNTENQVFFIIGLFVIFALSFTHPLTSYVLLVFLPFLYVFERISARISKRVSFLGRGDMKVLKAGSVVSSETSGKLILSFLVLGVPWIIFCGSSAPTYFMKGVQKIILGNNVGTFVPQLSLSSSSSTPLEKILIISSFVLIGLLSLYGLIRYVSGGNWRTEWIAITTYFGLMTIVTLSMINLSPDTGNLAIRVPHYLFISLAPLFGYAVVHALTTARGEYPRVKTNVTRWLIVLLLVCLSISVVDQMPRGYYFFRNEQVTSQLWEARSASLSISDSLRWYSSRTHSSALGISDVPIHDIGTGMYNLTLTYYNELYVYPSEINKNTIVLEEMDANYIFIDNLMSNYTEQWTYLVYSKPIPVSNLDFIVQNYTSFDKVYSNGVIDILCIAK